MHGQKVANKFNILQQILCTCTCTLVKVFFWHGLMYFLNWFGEETSKFLHFITFQGLAIDSLMTF